LAVALLLFFGEKINAHAFFSSCRASVIFAKIQLKKWQAQDKHKGLYREKYATCAKLLDVSSHDLRHRFGYRMAESVPLHRLAQIMGHDSLDTTKLYIQGTRHDLQQAVETIAWT
jgi:integrase